MEVSINRINSLQQSVRDIYDSSSNQSKRGYWQVIENETWEPAFIRTLPDRQPKGKIPFVVELGLGLWSKVLDFNLRDYYHDPLTYATVQLEIKAFHAKNFHDDTFIEKNFRLLIATTLEGSLMGVPFGYTEQGHPWLDYQNPPLVDYSDLKQLRIPDFYQSGEMPNLLSAYEKMKQVLDEDFLIKFPDWIMGPFGVAAELRGFDKLLMDLILEPQFVSDLLGHIVRSRHSWQKQLDAFLGISRSRGLLGNDDVNCPTLSPAQYRKFLLPIEKELCAHYGGIYYWHSCGQTTPLLPYIAEIPHLDLFHCGPWTSVEKACSVFAGTGTALEIMVEPVDKVQMASRQEMKNYLLEIKSQIPDETNCYIKVDSIEDVRNDLKIEIDNVIKWIEVAREVLG